jgi:2-(1,2-epoxy-1,2-dihydrophenyl)acetyl-CoA isomerase
LVLTNRMLSASEAAEWGIVTRAVADANLMNEAEELALQFAQGATKAYGAVKSLYQETWSSTLETQLERETRALSDMAHTEDAREGLRAFVNKEKPTFKGR